jgi:hypothetical protein
VQPWVGESFQNRLREKPANELFKIRTKWSIGNFQADNLLNSVRNKAFILKNLILRTVSHSLLVTQGGVSDRSSRNYALG